MNLLHKCLAASALAYTIFFPAHAQQVTCIPASTAAVTGASNPNGKWFAYRCGAKIEIVACTTDHCTDAVVNAVWWVVERGVLLADANSALKSTVLSASVTLPSRMSGGTTAQRSRPSST